jgi:DNA-binding NarL/FixJ family response regulator
MKILLTDDHVLIREALQGVLKEMNPGVIILQAASYSQGMRLAREHTDLEVILLDLNLPDKDGFQMLAELRELHPAASVIVLSASNDRADVMRAFNHGAAGFIPKSTQRSVMLSALQLVFSGGIYIPPEILASEQPLHLPKPKRSDPADFGLTERQGEVLALMTRGISNKAICRLLDLSESTVKSHVAAIFKALKVTNRTEAVMAVVEHRWDLGGRPPVS